MPAQRFEFLTVIQTHKVIGRDRFAYRYSRLFFLYRRRQNRRMASKSFQSGMHGMDQAGNSPIGRELLATKAATISAANSRDFEGSASDVVMGEFLKGQV